MFDVLGGRGGAQTHGNGKSSQTASKRSVRRVQEGGAQGAPTKSSPRPLGISFWALFGLFGRKVPKSGVFDVLGGRGGAQTHGKSSQTASKRSVRRVQEGGAQGAPTKSSPPPLGISFEKLGRTAVQAGQADKMILTDFLSLFFCSVEEDSHSLSLQTGLPKCLNDESVQLLSKSRRFVEIHGRVVGFCTEGTLSAQPHFRAGQPPFCSF